MSSRTRRYLCVGAVVRSCAAFGLFSHKKRQQATRNHLRCSYESRLVPFDTYFGDVYSFHSIEHELRGSVLSRATAVYTGCTSTSTNATKKQTIHACALLYNILSSQGCSRERRDMWDLCFCPPARRRSWGTRARCRGESCESLPFTLTPLGYSLPYEHHAGWRTACTHELLKNGGRAYCAELSERNKLLKMLYTAHVKSHTPNTTASREGKHSYVGYHPPPCCTPT